MDKSDVVRIFNEVIDYVGISVNELSKRLGYERSQALYDVLNIDKKVGISNKLVNDIISLYPEINEAYLVTGRGSLLLSEIIENKHGNKFALLPNGEYLMSMPCVEVEAQAGLIDSYSDVEYLSEMHQYAMIVDKVHHGRYVAFKVEGDSMDDGTVNSIPKGCKIATRELNKEHWTNKLHINEYPFWVIYTTRNSKPLVKEIISHDIKKGEIVCHSLNDSPQYSDFTLNMNEVQALFYIVDVNRRISNKEYY